MLGTYNIKEAQANFTKLCRSGRKFVISNRNRPVVVALPVEDFEALLETLDVLEDSAAMKAVRAVKAGTAKYRDLDLSDENFGLWASFDLALRVANAKQKTSERYSPRPLKSTFG